MLGQRETALADGSGLASFMGCGFSPSRAQSSTMTRSNCPTWGAASPMPGAWCMVSSMSAMSRRTRSSTRGTLLAFALRRGSGAVMIGRIAMAGIRYDAGGRSSTAGRPP
jgi:hypothetical protein